MSKAIAVLAVVLYAAFLCVILYQDIQQGVQSPPTPAPADAAWKIDCWRGAYQHEVYYSSAAPLKHSSGAILTDAPFRWFSAGSDCIVTKVESSK